MLLVAPLITRIYTPDDLGQFAIFSSVLSIASVAASLRYELAIPLPGRVTSARRILDLCFIFSVATAAVVCLLAYSLRHYAPQRLGVTTVGPYLWLLPAGVFLQGALRALTFWRIRQKGYKTISFARISQTAGTVVVQLLAGLAGLKGTGLFIGTVAGYLAGIVPLTNDVPPSSLFERSNSNALHFTALIRRYRRFPFYDIPASAINALSNELPQLLLAAVFNPALAGFYLLAQRVVGAPSAMIGQPISQVLYGRVPEALRERGLAKLVNRTVLGLACLILAPLVLAAIFAPSAFRLVFGIKWVDAGRIASILVFNSAFQFVYSPISVVLSATEAQSTNLLVQAVMLALKLLGIYVGWRLHDPMAAILGFSLAGAIAYGGGIIVIIRRSQALIASGE